MSRGVLSLVTILFCQDIQAAERFVGKAVFVTDGDTLWVEPDAGGPARKLRIDGIDAPEICQPGGLAARSALAGQVLHQTVRVQVKRLDDYGRGLARITVNDRDVGAYLVRSGQAWSYRWRRSSGPYSAEETAARQSGAGLFEVGQPELPREFRKRHGSCPTPNN